MDLRNNDDENNNNDENEFYGEKFSFRTSFLLMFCVRVEFYECCDWLISKKTRITEQLQTCDWPKQDRQIMVPN